MSDTLQLRVNRKDRVATHVVALELVDAHGHALPRFTAGAHVDVHLPGGLVRQYSLCNNPDETDRYLIAVLQETAGRGGSTAVHESVQVGDALRVSRPRNLFPLVGGASRSLLFAGGIGITPIVAMAETLAASGAAFELHYCARTQHAAAFFERLSKAPFARCVAFHLDDGNADQRLNLAETLAPPQAGDHLYVCGPPGFIDSVLDHAMRSGWREHQLHHERFSALTLRSETPTEFEIQIASSGQVITVAPDQSALAALEGVGIHIPFSCEQGICGTCVTGVTSGLPDHRDQFLTAAERASNERFLPCCSRAFSGRLVVDL